MRPAGFEPATSPSHVTFSTTARHTHFCLYSIFFPNILYWTESKLVVWGPKRMQIKKLSTIKFHNFSRSTTFILVVSPSKIVYKMKFTLQCVRSRAHGKTLLCRVSWCGTRQGSRCHNKGHADVWFLGGGPSAPNSRTVRRSRRSDIRTSPLTFQMFERLDRQTVRPSGAEGPPWMSRGILAECIHP